MSIAASNAWFRLPFRWQILSVVGVASLLTWLVAVGLAVYDSRGRAAVETHANMDLWQSLISAKAAGFAPDWGATSLYGQLARELRQVRHVSASITDIEGAVVVSTDSSAGSGTEVMAAPEAGAPHWFVELVQPALDIREFPFWVGSRRLGTVRLTAKPGDEIAEAWELLRQMSLLWLGGSMIMMIGLYFVLGRLLTPLVSFATGMRELEDGHYSFRVSEPRMRELRPIAANFNTLATALEAAQAENGRLYRQLLAVQEDERRQIAADLHDEFGPCLFGIGVSTAAIQRLGRSVKKPENEDILRSAAEISKINEHMKSLNRALLARLRPAALGRVTVDELMSGLITSFEQRHAEVEIERTIGPLPARLGDALELTIYRCLQEGLTNALRHGRATRIDLNLAMLPCGAASPRDGRADGSRAVRLVIRDNGQGLSESATPGLGLSAMRERVRALAGSLEIVPEAPGTSLVITIPFEITP